MSSRNWLISVLVLLQGLDLLLTWRLLTGRPDVGEANPVALALLERHGWAGMAGLKLASTLVALACVLLVCRTRPRAGRALLVGLCTVLLAVVGYSSMLLARPTGAEELSLAQLRRRAAALEVERAEIGSLVQQRGAICTALASGQLTLPRAAERMARVLREQLGETSLGSAWPSPDRLDRVAVYLIRHCEAGRSPVRGLREQLTRHYPQADWLAREPGRATGEPEV